MSLVKIQPYITDNVANFTFGGLTITANAVFGNANLGNLASANFVSVTSNITSGNANLGNLVVANYFSGNGSLLTGIVATTATSLVNGNSNVVVAANGNASISITGTSNVVVINSAGANISGYVNATRFVGEGGNLSNIQGANVSGAVSSATTAGTVTTAAQANITSLGLLANLSVNGYSSFIGNANIVGNINLSGGNANLGNAVYANYFIGDGSLLTGIQATYSNANVANYLPTYTGNIKAGNANLGNLATANYFSGGDLTVTRTAITNSIYFDGTNYANLTASTSMLGSGDYTIEFWIKTTDGDNGIFTNVNTGNSPTTGPAIFMASNNLYFQSRYAVATALNVSGATLLDNAWHHVAFVRESGTVSVYFDGSRQDFVSNSTDYSSVVSGYNFGYSPQTFNKLTGYLSNFRIVNGTAVYTGASFSVPTSPLTAISGTTLLTLQDTTLIDKSSYARSFTTTGSPTIGSSVVPFAGYIGTGNITSVNANLGNLVVANYFSGNGSLLTSLTGANITGYVPNANIANTAYAVAGANVTGQVSNSLVAGTVYTAAQPNITSLGTLTGLTVSGDSTFTGNLTVSGNFEYANVTSFRVKDPIIEQGGNTTGSALTSNDGFDRGQLLHYYSGGAIDAFMGWDNSNAEFAFGSNVTLSGEVVTFNTFGNVRANYFIGNGSQLTGLTATNANYANFAGNVINSSQPNITSVGTLTSLAVTGNITSGNATLGNLTTSNYFTGNGSLLTSLTGANITGTVANATYALNAGNAYSVTGSNVTGQVGNALIAGTVYTNAQPNITSVGTLSSLTVTGNITAGNINSGNLLTANYSTAVLTTAAQPNITSVGTLSSLAVTGNITSGNANLGNNVTANFFTGSGQYLTSITAVTAATVTSNAQPNITSVGTLTTVTIGNSTNTTTMNASSITSNVNVDLTGSNISLGAIGNIKITGGTSGYFITTDGAGNLSWGAAAGGGGVSATGSNTQIQFNDNGSLGASANLAFDKSTNTFTTGKVVASVGANLGSNVSNVYIGGGGVSQILATDGSGNLTWVSQPVATITVDNFTGDGTTTAYTLSTTPANINQTIVNYNGAFQLRTSSYTLSGPTITFTEAPVDGSKIEVTTTIGSTSGAGAFVTRTYTGNGVATTFTVTSGCTASSVIVTENGLVQTPTTDYTITSTTLTFAVAPANGVVIQIRELAIAIATTVSPAYRAYTGNGVANTFTVTSGLTANSLIIAENGIIQRPTTDYTVSGSTVTFVTAPANGVDIQIRELSLNGGMSTGGTSLPYQGANSGKYLTTDGATASWATVSSGSVTIKDEGSNLTTAVASIDFVGAGVTATNTGNAVTVTIPSGGNNARTTGYSLVFGG